VDSSVHGNNFIVVCSAGKAVIRAGENGAPFPLKRRDQLLDYILTLMGHDDDNDGFVNTSVELLRTQVNASASSTLVDTRC